MENDVEEVLSFFSKGVVGVRHSNVSEVLSILFSLENLQLVLSWELVCGE